MLGYRLERQVLCISLAMLAVERDYGVAEDGVEKQRYQSGNEDGLSGLSDST